MKSIPNIILYPMVILVIIGVSCEAADLFIKLVNSQEATPAQYRTIMERGTRFERSGDLELSEIIKTAVSDGILTLGEYKRCQESGDKIEEKHLIQSFRDGSYHFIEHDSIGVRYPAGYIERKKGGE
jgi:hypothetical protein